MYGFLIWTYVIVTASALPGISPDNYNCEATRKNKTSQCDGHGRDYHRLIRKFVMDVTYRKFSHCFAIEVNNHDTAFQQQITRIPPSITLDIRSNSSQNTFRGFNIPPRRFIIRFQYQCIVYFISIRGPQLEQTLFSRLAMIFQTPGLQILAPSSYIFITTGKDHQSEDHIGHSVLLSPSLRNYGHKILISAVQRETGRGTRRRSETFFHIRTFCFFCNGGDPGIFKGSKVFGTSYAVRQVDQLFPEVTHNLYGKALKVTAAMALPFVGILGSSGGQMGLRVEGMQAVILKAVARALNFTIVLENTSKGVTGSRLPNGTWTGTIGEVLSGRSDMGLNAAPTADRHQVVDFTVPGFYGFLVLVSTKPSPFFEWQAIIHPFEPGTWLGICLCTIGTVILYRFFLRRGKPLKKYGRRQRQPRKSTPSYFKVCYITLGSLLEQGLPFHYGTSPARVYALFWFMFVIVGTCAYKSKLFSYLTFPIIKTPPSTFHELSVSDYKWGLKSLGGVAFLFITKSPVPYIRSVGERMEILLSMDKYSCIDRTFSEKYVCIIYRAYYDYMSAVRYWKISHKFHVSDYVAPPVGSSWVLPKYSPLLHTLDRLTHSQFEMGLSGIYLEHYIKEMALRSRALAQASTDAKDLFELNTKFERKMALEKPLEFANVYAGFLILLFGFGISIGALFTEFLRYNSEKKRQQIAARRLRVLRMVMEFSFLRQQSRLTPKNRMRHFRNANFLLCGTRKDALNAL